MTAFVRFRALGDTNERFAAWFEPEHFTLERTAPFFAERFANMEWAILTPYRSAFWDRERLTFGEGARKEDVPAEDALEEAWRTYFASIFNPARLKVSAMTSEMPRKYWRNLPEAEIIPDLIRSAQKREMEMIKSEASVPPERHRRRTARGGGSQEETPVELTSLRRLKEAAQRCTRCPLYENATQVVVGEGPSHAPLMMVGEQPGDREDIEGHPFVGPAGQLLDTVLGEVRIDRKKVFVTNAVKHFKFVPRGKRRIHQKPNGGEVSACRFWLDHERALVGPKVIVALGATAAQSLLGSGATISKLRGSPLALEDGTTVFVTVHPSFLLRMPDREKAAEERRAFARDLAAIREHMEGIKGASVTLDRAPAGP
jgi:DNA polymerase